jgi:hypothetical protein
MMGKLHQQLQCQLASSSGTVCLFPIEMISEGGGMR